MALTTLPNAMLSFDGGSLIFRNRIINGDMRVDQRNAGAAVTTDGSYPVDRFRMNLSAGAGISAQRSTAVVPTGFTHALGLTVTSTKTPAAADQFDITHKVEGLNVADLAWGSASAQSITLSFWVRASVTGTYAVAVMNAANNRSYVANYTVSASNTWEQKTITIAGDTTGTWVTTSADSGITLRFDLGSGSNRNTTAGAWAAGNYTRTSGSVSLVSNSSATLHVTGVQLERGTVATPFERRPYSVELLLCQRYLRALKSGLVGFWASSTAVRLQCTWPGMRATPTFSQSGTLTVTDNSSNSTQSSASVTDNGSDADGGQIIIGNVSGGTANRVAAVLSSSAGSILVSAEL